MSVPFPRQGDPDVVTVTPNPALDWTLEVPEFTPGAVNRVAREYKTAAGKGVNVAAALADHGVHVAVTGLLGRANATPFEDMFASRGIVDRFVRVDGDTRVGIRIADAASGRTTDVNFPGHAATHLDEARLVAQVTELAARGRPWFVLSGSLPPGVAGTLHRELARAARAAGCHVALDTSGEALRHALEAVPTVVKPNVHELESLVGGALESREALVSAARTLVDRGVELVAVSMGEAGALFVRRGAVVAARAPRAEPRTTAGAGDAMVAGIVVGLRRNLSLADLARLASAFALDAITRGAGDGESPAARVDALAARVEVEQVA